MPESPISKGSYGEDLTLGLGRGWYVTLVRRDYTSSAPKLLSFTLNPKNRGGLQSNQAEVGTKTKLEPCDLLLPLG